MQEVQYQSLLRTGSSWFILVLMNEKALNILEYHKIIDMLAEKTGTPLGREQALSLVPSPDPEWIRKEQQETADALSRIISFGTLSCSGARDIRGSLLRLKVGASLNITELLSIAALLRAADRVRSYGRHRDRVEFTDSLDPYFNELEPLQLLLREIDRCIISEEEIADDASPELRSIRRKMQSASGRIHSELQALVNSRSNYLQQPIITMRNGRYCIPVRSEYRQMVPGMIHDESGSGSTVFIEPMSVVRLNNEIRELQIAEQKEIEAILARLSTQAADHEHVLGEDLRILSRLDFIFAKASLAREMDAVQPEFSDDRSINIKKARHPLLPRNKVVPIDVQLGEHFRQLIITGPNTGGKTVSLKTVGLLSLMGQAGLHIPAFLGSRLGIYTEIYADIGDEQSIEQSLSTFSSHMKNIIRILDQADSESLVLFDELCAGTDPNEGAALAIAILQFLHRLSVNTMATTHYSELKLFALSTEGVENASCEFDVATLSPTYRLLIGIPGKSNAFAISEKLGLPGFIIDEAKGRIDTESERFEDVIKNLDASRKEIEKEQMELTALRGEAARLRDSLSRQEAKLNADRDRIISAAKQEARALVQDAKDQVDETIRRMNRIGSGDTRALEQERTRMRELLDKHTEKMTRSIEKAGTQAKDLHIGDSVQVLSMNLKGTVSTLPDAKGNLFVQMGILRSQVHISDVVPIQEDTVSVGGKKIQSTHSGIGRSKAATISPELNLIGKTVDEALPLLEKYLDDAYLSHIPQVRIVHGRGTGALRQAVQNKLKKLKYIESYRLGEFGEGDSGVTIAIFK